jgi:hypothetical protein
VLLGVLAGSTLLVSALPTRADVPWADANYRYRRPLTIYNPQPASLAAGDVAAYSYIPDYGPLEGKGRLDGKDVKIYYSPDGTSNVDVPQYLLPMGRGAGKVLFALQKPIGASVPYQLNENTNAGRTAYSSLPTGARLTFDGSDDADTQITLPFNFPFKTGTTNKLLVAIDGYVVPDGDPAGNYLRYDLDSLSNAVSKAFIAPWLSDFSIWGPTQGVWADIQPSQVTIRWEVQPSTGGDVLDVIAKFALILKPDGSIRFVYGSPCTQDSVAISYSPPKYGVGAGDAVFSKVTEPGFEDYANHADITYTQTFGAPVESTGYWLYYGNPGDDGKTGRTPLPPAKCQAWTFDDNTLQGWVPASEITDCGSGNSGYLVAENGMLKMQGFQYRSDGSRDLYPRAVPSNQTGFFGDSIVYARMLTTDVVKKVGTMVRTNNLGTGYQLFIDGWGNTSFWCARAGCNDFDAGRTQNLGSEYRVDMFDGIWINQIAQVTGTGENISLNGKIFPDGQTEPTKWTNTGSVSATDREWARWDTGTVGFAGGRYFDDVQYLDWMYVTSPTAENTFAAAGAEQENPNFGTVTGTVTFNGVGLKDAILTFTPAAGAAKVINTDAAGAYKLPTPAGTYSVKVDTIYPGVFDSQTTSLTLAVGEMKTLNFSLAAKPNLVANPSFEEEDPQFSGKPRGWFRRSYGGISSPTADNRNTDLSPWIYRKDMGRTGTHCVGFDGTTADIQSWEVESSAVGTVNPDQRGGAALPRIPYGATLYYEFWYKKAGSTGDVRHRPRFCTADDVALLTSGGTSIGASAAASEWTKLSGTYANTDPGAASVANFLAYRIYGVNTPAGEPVYVDDVTVSLVSIPASASSQPYSGIVQDANGAPLANAVVGISDKGNGLADARKYVLTDGVGRFTFETLPVPASQLQVQPYYDMKKAGPSVPFAPAGEKTIITYNVDDVYDIAKGKPVVAYSTQNNEETATAAAKIVDGDEGSYWFTQDSDDIGAKGYPQYVVIDLGKSYDFGTQIKQITLANEGGNPKGYQIRVSNTPPTFNGPLDSKDFPTALAAWGSAVYISANGGTAAESPTQDSRFFYIPNKYPAYRMHRTDVITSLQPATGRYLMLLYTKTDAAVSTFELKVEAYYGKISGRVVSANGTPVEGAYVGQHPDGLGYGKTAADGTYSASIPALGPIAISAHKVDDANTVYGLSDSLTITPSSDVAASVPDLVLGSAVPNLVTSGASATTEPCCYEEKPATDALDRDLTTRWVTPSIPNTIYPEAPLAFVADLGSTVMANQIVINWESAYSYGYRVDVSTDGSNYTTIYSTLSGTGGYNAASGRYVDVIPFTQRSLRYISIVTTVPGPISDRVSIWELQVANVTPPPFSQARKALRIAGGLATASSADLSALNVNTSGASAGKVDLLDALTLAKQGK